MRANVSFLAGILVPSHYVNVNAKRIYIHMRTKAHSVLISDIFNRPMKLNDDSSRSLYQAQTLQRHVTFSPPTAVCRCRVGTRGNNIDACRYLETEFCHEHAHQSMEVSLQRKFYGPMELTETSHCACTVSALTVPLHLKGN